MPQDATERRRTLLDAAERHRTPLDTPLDMPQDTPHNAASVVAVAAGRLACGSAADS